MNHWSSAYLGLPWQEGGTDRDGISCWGLVRLAYSERCGLSLPSYAGAPGVEEVDEIASALSGDGDRWPWIEVAESDVRELDLVTFKLGGIESHIGLIPWRGVFLNVLEGLTSNVHHYGDERWRPLVSRFLRHKVLN